MKIDNVIFRIISDSRKDDTLEAELFSDNLSAIASVPSGKSTGKREAANIAPAKALEKREWINSQIREHEFATLEEFDSLLMTLDGTSDKSKLGANLILVLSIAFTKLLAKKGGMEIYELISKISGNRIKLPLCFFNLIEGGVHDDLLNGLPFQEYLFIPQTTSPQESLEEALSAIKNLEKKIQEKYGHSDIGDEGGYTVPSTDPLMGLEILQEVYKATPCSLAQLSLDVAASTFWRDGKYYIGDKIMDTDELISYYKLIINTYKLLSIEDPFSEEDFEAFSKITSELGDKIWIVGDDLTTTNVRQIKEAYEKNSINAVIIKPNQIGSVSETIQAANLAKSYGWKIIVSHRSGETMDTFIADLAVGLSADGFKSGCPLQKERLVKYQRLEEIESRVKSLDKKKKNLVARL